MFFKLELWLIQYSFFNIIYFKVKVKYTIIVPHKNCPQLLQRLLDSIPLRPDMQVIVIDDNSDASIVDFINFPGINRNDVELIFSKELNRGAGYARNLGLHKAQGSWILFADSDDYYENNAFDVLDECLSSNLDVLYFGAYSRSSETLELSSNRRVFSNECVINYKSNDSISDLKIRYWNSAPWNKVVNHQLIIKHNLQFEELKMNNDVFFALSVGLHAKEYKVLRKNLYNFTFRSNSISTVRRNLQEENLLLINRIRTNQFYKSIKANILIRPYAGILLTVLRRNGFLYFIRYIFYLTTQYKYLIKIRNNWNNYKFIK